MTEEEGNRRSMALAGYGTAGGGAAYVPQEYPKMVPGPDGPRIVYSEPEEERVLTARLHAMAGLVTGPVVWLSEEMAPASPAAAAGRAAYFDVDAWNAAHEDKGKKAEEAELLVRGRKRLARIASDDSDNRKLELDDLRHETGEGQWPQDVAAQRNFDKRPCLTLNKLPTFVNQVLNRRAPQHDWIAALYRPYVPVA